jgi:hypothetical protein
VHDRLSFRERTIVAGLVQHTSVSNVEATVIRIVTSNTASGGELSGNYVTLVSKQVPETCWMVTNARASETKQLGGNGGTVGAFHTLPAAGGQVRPAGQI